MRIFADDNFVCLGRSMNFASFPDFNKARAVEPSVVSITPPTSMLFCAWARFERKTPPISAFPPTSRLFDNLSEPSTSTRAPRKRLLLENRALFWQ